MFGKWDVLILLAVASLLGSLVRTEERFILEDATCSMSDIYGTSESPASLISGSFGAFLHTTNSATASKWYRIELPEPLTVVSFLLIHDCRDVSY